MALRCQQLNELCVLPKANSAVQEGSVYITDIGNREVFKDRHKNPIPSKMNEKM